MITNNPQQLKIWLIAIAEKDAQAFRLLYDAVSPKLYGFLLRILLKPEWAEEVLQESFISIWNHAASYQPALAAPMTWMTAIVRNKACDMLRQTHKTIELDMDNVERDTRHLDKSVSATPMEVLEMTINAQALAQSFVLLGAMNRQVITLAFYHDLSHSEVASHLKLPVGTVKSLIRRGLQDLKVTLRRQENAAMSYAYL